MVLLHPFKRQPKSTLVFTNEQIYLYQNQGTTVTLLENISLKNSNPNNLTDFLKKLKKTHKLEPSINVITPKEVGNTHLIKTPKIHKLRQSKLLKLGEKSYQDSFYYHHLKVNIDPYHILTLTSCIKKVWIKNITQACTKAQLNITNLLTPHIASTYYQRKTIKSSVSCPHSINEKPIELAHGALLALQENRNRLNILPIRQQLIQKQNFYSKYILLLSIGSWASIFLLTKTNQAHLKILELQRHHILQNISSLKTRNNAIDLLQQNIDTYKSNIFSYNIAKQSMINWLNCFNKLQETIKLLPRAWIHTIKKTEDNTLHCIGSYFSKRQKNLLKEDISNEFNSFINELSSHFDISNIKPPKAETDSIYSFEFKMKIDP